MKKIRNGSAHSQPDIDQVVSDLKNEIKEIRAVKLGISETQQKELVERISKSINLESSDAVLQLIKEKISAIEQSKLKMELVEAQCTSTIHRLREELYSLSKRGNLNLSIGIMITVVGLSILGMFILAIAPSSVDITKFLVEFSLEFLWFC